MPPQTFNFRATLISGGKGNGVSKSELLNSSWALVSGNLLSRHVRYEGASSFVHLYTTFKVSFIIKSSTVCQPSFLII